tara:strand:- start:26 stop:220 length:195 start_codon:yes stop_codon:yes gene_type:complete
MTQKQLKIFITKFIHDELEFVGPDIHADSYEQAELIAELQGLIIEGELTDLIAINDFNRPKVLH